MGLLDIFKRKSDDRSDVLTIYDTDITQWNSDSVRQAFDRICSEVSLTQFAVVEEKEDGSFVLMKDDVSNVLKNPNQYMTMSEFLYKLSYLLLKNENAYIYPTYINDRLVSLEPITGEAEIYTMENGVKQIRFKYIDEATGNTKISDWIPLSSIVHIKYHFSDKLDYGGMEDGERLLTNNIDAQNDIMSSIKKAAKTNIKGIYKANVTLNDKNKMKQLRDEFEENFAEGKSGIAVVDGKGEFTAAPQYSSTIDKSILSFTDELVLRHFKTSIPIMNTNYNREEYEAFYKSCIKPILKNISEGLTKCLYYNRAIYNREVRANVKNLSLMEDSNMNETLKILTNVGAIRRNELRECINLMPLSESEGGNDLIMALNYAEVLENEKGTNKDE